MAVLCMTAAAELAGWREFVGTRYRQARSAWTNAPTQATNVWRFAQASFDWAELATNHSHRAAIATEAIHACQQTLAHSPESAPVLYYLGLNLGELAQTRGLSALKLVREMETRWSAARTLDPGFDHAGPDRCLGLLYLDAPGWPVSLGNPTKARAHLEAAVERSGDFPENLLCLAEAELRWKHAAAARKLLERVDRIWEDARKRWVGGEFEASWKDWNHRRDKLRASMPPNSR